MMPLFRYLICVGSMLLAGILITDRLGSRSLSKERPEFDRTVIRINSTVRVPDRVVIDTALPTFTTPPAVGMVATEEQKKFEKLNESFAAVQLPMPNTARKTQKTRDLARSPR